MTTLTAINNWLSSVERTRSAGTAISYGYAVLGHTPDSFEEIDLDWVEAFIWRKKPKPATVRARRAALSSFLEYCRKRGLVERNYARDVDVPKVAPKDVQPFTEKEWNAIWAAACLEPGVNPATLALLHLLYWTGMRIGDALALGPDNFDLEKSRITFRAGKNRKQVSMCVPSGTGYSFLSYSDIIHEHGVRYWQRQIAKVFKAAGVEGTPHQFRHTLATRMRDAGIPVEQVAYVLGDTIATVEKTYFKESLQWQDKVDESMRGLW